jgi:hypothetical protein
MFKDFFVRVGIPSATNQAKSVQDELSASVFGASLPGLQRIRNRARKPEGTSFGTSMSFK